MATAQWASLLYITGSKNQAKRKMEYFLYEEDGLRKLSDYLKEKGIRLLAEGDDFTCTHKGEEFAEVL